MLQVFSEIHPLKRVLLHRPGLELEHLTPDRLDRLLFDDIPFLDAAQSEHDQFAQKLRDHGVDVVYLADLMAETLAADAEIKNRFVEDFISESGMVAAHYRKELQQILLSLPNERDLVLKTMAGIKITEAKMDVRGPLVKTIRRDTQFLLDPIPNLYFTRDPFASIGSGVSLNRMYSDTRQRETIYGRYILEYHPDFRGRVPFYYRCESPFSIEGGDILVLSDHALAIGISQRTSPEAIEQLATSLFSAENALFDTILVFNIPSLRAYMHLDTVFTQVDYDKFTVHAGILSPLRLYRLSKKANDGSYRVEEEFAPLEQVLQDVLDMERIELIHCGGQDDIAAEREQWNDGANTLCLAPGLVVAYNRNKITNEIMRDHGISVLEVPSSELSRGRGGPRCMSMPLWREKTV